MVNVYLKEITTKNGLVHQMMENWLPWVPIFMPFASTMRTMKCLLVGYIVIISEEKLELNGDAFGCF